MEPFAPPARPLRPATDPPAPLPPGYTEAEEQQSPFAQDREPGHSWLRRKLSAAGAALLALIAKLKAILLLLPKLKLLVTFGSMFVSIFAWSTIFGLPLAVGFVALLFVHEMGHVLELRRIGIKASPPIFIPFLGAVIGARSLGDNALAEARVGLAGPVAGAIGSVGCLFLWHATGHEIWRALAYLGFLLNLFNLIPMLPLDGGRAMAAMAPWMWSLGFVGLIVVAFIFPSPIILVILVLGGYETYRRWQARKDPDAAQEAYYQVAPIDRLLIAAVYISLIALLAVGIHATYFHSTPV